MKKRGQKLPGYYMEKPMFPCIRIIRPLFGEVDAAIQTNELALRFLEDEGKRMEIEFNEFLIQLADKYKISHGNSNYEYVKNAMSKLNIINTFNNVEYFMKKFNKEYTEYKKIDNCQWKRQDDKGNQLDPLNQYYYNLPNTSKSILSNIPEFHLVEYYRLVRNYFVHKDTSKSDKIKTLYEKIIRDYESHFKKCYKLVPHMVDSISYEDYFLYTRSFKYLVNKLNDIADLKMIEIVNVALTDKKFLEKLHSLEHISIEGIKRKRKEVIKKYYSGNYGYGKRKDHCEKFLECFMEHDVIKWGN